MINSWIYHCRNAPFVMPLKPLDYNSAWKCRRCSTVIEKTDVENMVAGLLSKDFNFCNQY